MNKAFYFLNKLIPITLIYGFCINNYISQSIVNTEKLFSENFTCDYKLG